MAEVGNLTINITFPDEDDIKKLSGIIGGMVEEKYKQMMEDQKAIDTAKQHNLKLEAQLPDEMFTKFKTLISESKLGGSVCCGMVVGVETKPRPFITVDGETYISNAHITDLGVSFQGGMFIKESVIVQSADYVKGVSGWLFDNGTGDFELNGDDNSLLKRENGKVLFSPYSQNKFKEKQ